MIFYMYIINMPTKRRTKRRSYKKIKGGECNNNIDCTIDDKKKIINEINGTSNLSDKDIKSVLTGLECCKLSETDIENIIKEIKKQKCYKTYDDDKTSNIDDKIKSLIECIRTLNGGRRKTQHKRKRRL